MKKINAYTVIVTALLLIAAILSLFRPYGSDTKNHRDVSHPYILDIHTSGIWDTQEGVGLCLENGKALIFWDGEMPDYAEWKLVTPDGETAVDMTASWVGYDELTMRTWSVSITGNTVQFRSWL